MLKKIYKNGVVQIIALSIVSLLMLVMYIGMIFYSSLEHDPVMEEKMEYVEKMKPIYKARNEEWEKEDKAKKERCELMLQCGE